MDNIIVSIIVPVYNAGNYLRECVEGVIKQTFLSWELLLFDDGSTDNSYEIARSFAAFDSRVIVYHKSNSGVSDTRNIALDYSRGKYIIFLDADDYWYDDSFLEMLVSLAEANNLDIIRGEYKAVSPEGKDLFIRKIPQNKMKIANKVIDSADFIRNAIAGEFFLVLSLFRKDAIGGTRLKVDQIFLEDMRFYSIILMNSLRCMYVPITFYAYRKNPTSVSYTLNPQKISDSFAMCDFFHNCAYVSASLSLKEYFDYYSAMMYKWTLVSLSSDGYYNNRRDLIKSLEIETLRQRVLKWITMNNIRVTKVQFYISPLLAINISRLLNRVKEGCHNLKCLLFQ